MCMLPMCDSRPCVVHRAVWIPGLGSYKAFPETMHGGSILPFNEDAHEKHLSNKHDVLRISTDGCFV